MMKSASDGMVYSSDVPWSRTTSAQDGGRATWASGMEISSPRTIGTRARTRCWPARSKTMPLFARNQSIRVRPAGPGGRIR